MVILDILNLEKENTQITLHKEGLFVRAYERSAYLFTKRIKEYTITKKFYKNVKQEVVYIGFPKNSLSKIKTICKEKNLSLKQEKKQIKITEFTSFTEKEFVIWKNGVTLIKSKDVVQSPHAHYLKENIIIEKIRNFPLISKTPIDCQQFIIALQTEIQT